jgi:hypothetical protein
MPIQIRMHGERAEEELRSLHAWLQDEPDVRRHARISLIAHEPKAGEMGPAFEVVQLIVNSGFQALSLAIAYAAWRSSRPTAPKVTIERGGTRLTLTEADEATVARIVQALERGEA